MNSLILPNPSRNRALFIIDIQPGFVKPENEWIIPNVERIINEGAYSFFVDAIFHADPGSIWDKEEKWTFELSPTVPEIKKLLNPESTLFITKTTKSAFAAGIDLVHILRDKGIEEVHIVGYDINDCVMATANDAFDAGFFAYVIEEGADSSENAEMKKDALEILRENEMTNHSELITDKKII